MTSTVAFSLLFSLFILGDVLASEEPDLRFCTRIPGKTRLLSFWVDGLRADILENYMYLLPNFQRLLHSGVNASCPTFSSSSCARSTLGNRYAPNPIDYRMLGGFNVTDDESEANYNATYHWTTFAGFASVATGFDTPYLKLHGNSLSDGELFYTALSTTSGTFLRQARENGYVTAVTGCPSVLSSSWSSTGTPSVKNITYGVLDYECGVDVNGIPTVDPSSTSTCNMDYRRAISEDEFLASSDNLGADFVTTLVSRGCAHVIVYHMNAPDFAMHEFGIGSPEYIQALIATDTLIGSVLDVLEKNSEVYGYNYLVLTTSDHGGAEIGVAPYINLPNKGMYQRLDHSSNWLRDEVVPFIVSSFGPSAATLYPLSNVHNFDFTPTALEYLGISNSDHMNGIVQGLVKNSS